MTTIQKKIAIAMLATGMTGAGVTMTEMAAHAAPAAVVQKDTSVRTTPSASQSDAQRYAAREGTSHKQLDYKGGAFVVIGATTAGLVLLLVLALLLL